MWVAELFGYSNSEVGISSIDPEKQVFVSCRQLRQKVYRIDQPEKVIKELNRKENKVIELLVLIYARHFSGKAKQCRKRCLHFANKMRIKREFKENPTEYEIFGNLLPNWNFEKQTGRCDLIHSFIAMLRWSIAMRTKTQVHWPPEVTFLMTMSSMTKPKIICHPSIGMTFRKSNLAAVLLIEVNEWSNRLSASPFVALSTSELSVHFQCTKSF